VSENEATISHSYWTLRGITGMYAASVLANSSGSGCQLLKYLEFKETGRTLEAWFGIGIPQQSGTLS